MHCRTPSIPPGDGSIRSSKDPDVVGRQEISRVVAEHRARIDTPFCTPRYFRIHQLRFFEFRPIIAGSEFPPVAALVLAIDQRFTKATHPSMDGRICSRKDALCLFASLGPGPGVVLA